MNQRIKEPVVAAAYDTGLLRIDDAEGFLSSVAMTCDTFELPFERMRSGVLVITTGIGTIEMRPGRDGVLIEISAPTDGTLFMLRETVATQIETVAPERLAALEWRTRIEEGSFPPNFRVAQVESVVALGLGFWRMTVTGADLQSFARDGLHIRLALPTRGAPPLWPMLNQKGRVTWPSPDRLHVAVYTIREIDPATGRVTIDIFRHEGGRTSDWMVEARPGEAVGLIGPGGGWLPDAGHLVIAGDETALPAIARILETAAPDMVGTAIVEMDSRKDYPPLTAPPSVTLHVLERSKGERLETVLAHTDLGPEGDRYIWFGAEKSRAAAVRADLRERRGVGRAESYVSGYWQCS